MKRKTLLLTLAFGMCTLYTHAETKITSIQVKKNGDVKLIVTSDVPFQLLATRDFKTWTTLDRSKEKRHEVFIDHKDATKFAYRFFVVKKL